MIYLDKTQTCDLIFPIMSALIEIYVYDEKISNKN